MRETGILRLLDVLEFSKYLRSFYTGFNEFEDTLEPFPTLVVNKEAKFKMTFLMENSNFKPGLVLNRP